MPVLFMIDDGVKGEGVEDDQVVVADIAIHMLEALERGDALAERQALTPLVESPVSITSSPVRPAGEIAAAAAPVAVLEAGDAVAADAPEVEIEIIDAKTETPDTEVVEEAEAGDDIEVVEEEAAAEGAETTEAEVVEAEASDAEEDASAEAAQAVAPAAASAVAAGSGEVDSTDSAAWRTVEPDDLKVIKGIGPKLESLLHEIGVRTYEQIAAFPADYIEQLDDFLSFTGRINRDNWVGQAAELAQTRPAKTSALPPIPDDTPDNATAQ